MTNSSKIALLGTAGVPGRYGGFETLAENLVHYHTRTKQKSRLTVWCSGKGNKERPNYYKSADLRYVNISANGASSVVYDIVSIYQAVRLGYDHILLLGVSGALALPLVRLFSRVHIVTNIDGIEWKRAKWNGMARLFLKWSEKLAVKFSHDVVADNRGIAEHVLEYHGRDCHVISYGGDHAVATPPAASHPYLLPQYYSLSLCRIEPENNVDMILEAFANMPSRSLVFIGNWENSEYGRFLRNSYSVYTNIYLCDPVYEPDVLRVIRDNASLYVHGHSAGGTNPSLVEMMHLGLPVLAYDCNFNRYTTEEMAIYFDSSDTIIKKISMLESSLSQQVGQKMKEIALRRYTWSVVGKDYFDILTGKQSQSQKL